MISCGSIKGSFHLNLKLIGSGRRNRILNDFATWQCRHRHIRNFSDKNHPKVKYIEWNNGELDNYCELKKKAGKLQWIYTKLGTSPGEGNGNPLQCSCLENPRDLGAWWAAVYGVAQSRTRLKRLCSSSSMYFTMGRTELDMAEAT